ncbi:hypothetical protein ATCC90586_004072 [Pythium insidiosum]|nr:hypothetical protein ATCC90586_004072 [Pythium insidiosum]
MHPTTLSLRQSRKTGLLTLDTAAASVSFRYPHGKTPLFKRTLVRPVRCVVGRQVLKVFAGSGKQSAFVCRLSNPQDVMSCMEALRVMGVDVVHVAPEVFLRPREQQPSSPRPAATAERSDPEDALKEELSALLATLQDSRRSRELVARISAYSQSPQLEQDIATISTAFFGGL